MENTKLWMAAGLFVVILIIAGIVHLAFRTSARLYANMYATDEKQTNAIFALEKRMNEIDQKLVLFEQHLKFEARGK